MFSVTSNNKQKVTIAASPDGPIDGALRVTSQDGDATVVQNAATPLEFTVISGEIAGQSHFLVEGDIRAGEEIVLISEVVEYTVSLAEATGFGLSAGVVELK